ELAVFTQLHNVGMRRGETGQALRDHVVDAVEEFLHCLSLDLRLHSSSGACIKCASRTPMSCSRRSSCALRSGSFKSGRRSSTLPNPVRADGRASRPGCARSYAARNASRSAAEKWHTARIDSTYCAGIGVE